MLCTTYRKPLVTVGSKMRGSEVTCTISGDRRQPMQSEYINFSPAFMHTPPSTVFPFPLPIDKSTRVDVCIFLLTATHNPSNQQILCVLTYMFTSAAMKIQTQKTRSSKNSPIGRKDKGSKQTQWMLPAAVFIYPGLFLTLVGLCDVTCTIMRFRDIH